MDLLPPPLHVVSPPPVSGLGIASFTLGVIALMFSWLPIAGCAAIPFAVVGLALGIPALCLAAKHRNRGLGFPIAGVVTNALAIAICLFVVFAIAATASSAAKRQNQMFPPPPSWR